MLAWNIELLVITGTSIGGMLRGSIPSKLTEHQAGWQIVVVAGAPKSQLMEDIWRRFVP